MMPIVVTLLSVTIGMYIALIIGYKIGYSDAEKKFKHE